MHSDYFKMYIAYHDCHDKHDYLLILIGKTLVYHCGAPMPLSILTSSPVPLIKVM